jgi:hypothetical protein
VCGCLWKRLPLSTQLLVPVLLLLSAAVQAQTENIPVSPLVTVLVLPLSLGEEADLGFHEVLATAMELQLEQAGLLTLRLGAEEEEALSARYSARGELDFDAESARLFEISNQANADFLLLGGYIKSEEGIKINFFLADVETGKLLASTARQVRIDFSLDRVMFQALEEMRIQAEQPIARVAGRKEAARPAGEREADRSASEDALSEAPRPEAIPPAPAAESAEEARPRHHEFSIGFAPYVPVGWSSEAFNLSYAPFVYYNHRRAAGRGMLGMGVFAAVNVLEPVGVGLASYMHTLISAGADFRFGSPEDRRLGLFARLSAGGAVNVSDFSKLPEPEALSRFMAFGAAGGGAMIAISPGVGLAVDVTCEAFVYFWQQEKGGAIRPQWIMGLLPSIYIYTRL